MIGVTALSALTARGQGFTNEWNSGFSNSGIVPDASTTGWWDTRTITGQSGYIITDVNLTLTLSGGYNGDLYAYLYHDNTLVVLLNRVGVTSGNAFGYSQSGMDVRFDDQAATTTDIHSYQTVNSWTITGVASWRPDGRNISPISSGLAFDNATRQNSGNPLSQLINAATDGDWTLFLSDLSVGGEATVVKWGIEAAASPIPEPTAAALVLFGGLLMLRRRR